MDDAINNDGWIGSANQLYHALECFKCDKDADGRFCVNGNITSFLGMADEFCVGSNAVYYVGGEKKHLVSALRSTSYGIGITVI